MQISTGNIFLELIGLGLNTLRKNKLWRTVIIGFSLVGLIASFVMFAIAPYFVEPLQNFVMEFARPIIGALISTLVLCLVSFTEIDLTSNSINEELSQLRSERTEIKQRLAESRTEEETKEETVLDNIQLSLNQITEYYTINKSQARNSFGFSVFAMVAGLTTLIASIWMFNFSENTNINLAWITGISGVMAQFIGAAYFYLYNKSLKQLNFFYAKLVKMQDTMLAIQLSETLEKDKESEVKEKLIMELMNRSSTGLV